MDREDGANSSAATTAAKTVRCMAMFMIIFNTTIEVLVGLVLL